MPARLPVSRAAVWLAALLIAVPAVPAVAQRAAPEQAGSGRAARTSGVPTLTGRGPVVRLTIDGMVDTALAQRVARAVAQAEATDASALVVRVDTYGGLLDAGDAIRTSLLGTTVPVVAVVDRNAASAGALITYAADTIVMVPGASIGAATAVDGATGEAAPEKVQSYTRGLMRATAEANGRDPQIAEAMVDPRLGVPGTVEPGRLVTLSAQEALRLGVADAVLPSVDAAVAAVRLANRAQVLFGTSPAERALRFLGSPVVAAVLLMLLVGGLFFEIQAPGLSVAGAVAVAAGLLFFAPHYLLGLAASWEVVVFGIGVVLLLIEVFVVPGFGAFGVSGLVLVLASLVLALVPNAGLDVPAGGALARALGTLGAALVLTVLLGASVARWLPRSGRFNRLVLVPDLASADGYTAADTDDSLVGQRGTAVTPLRPAGTAAFGERRVDVVSQGSFVLPGAAVEVVSARGSRVEVREV
ncbi:MAG TPA: NfeD family protein [Rubricoccaceae bacterium]